MLFYVPIFEYTSIMVGPCNGTTHQQRMAAASERLRRAPSWQHAHGQV